MCPQTDTKQRSNKLPLFAENQQSSALSEKRNNRQPFSPVGAQNFRKSAPIDEHASLQKPTQPCDCAIRFPGQVGRCVCMCVCARFCFPRPNSKPRHAGPRRRLRRPGFPRTRRSRWDRSACIRLRFHAPAIGSASAIAATGRLQGPKR